MAIDEPERVWGFAEAAGPTAGGFGVLGKDDDGKREKLCVRETFRVRIWDASLTHFAETLVRLIVLFMGLLPLFGCTLYIYGPVRPHARRSARISAADEHKQL